MSFKHVFSSILTVLETNYWSNEQIVSDYYSFLTIAKRQEISLGDDHPAFVIFNRICSLCMLVVF